MIHSIFPFSLSFSPPNILLLHLFSFPSNISCCHFALSVFSWCWSFFVLRADINECERLPRSCAHQCINTPGSFKCTCPAGRHLLGDGKSCAGLERLPTYESYSYGYRTSQSSPEQTPNQRMYHSFASHSYNSFTATTSRRYMNRNRRETHKQTLKQDILACKEGFESRCGHCLGKYVEWKILK